MSEVKRYNPELERDGGLSLPCLTMRQNHIGSFVEYEDYAALQQRLDAAEKKVEKFAVQCAAAKIAAAYAKEGRHDYALNTPDIDAYLNSVRAEGVEMLAENLATPDPELANGTNAINKAVAWYSRQFAAQLRAGQEAK